MGGKILDSNLYYRATRLSFYDRKVDGIFQISRCGRLLFFFSKSNVDGFTENYTKLVQKRKHAHLESVGCTQIAASIL